MSSEYERLAAEKYVALTTYRRTGDPVATPVWLAGDGGELLVWSERQAGKVKRIRRDPAVAVQACDVRGRRTHGAEVRGKARILDGAGSDRARRAIARKYGLLGQVTMFFSRLRGGRDRTVGIAITLDG
ncbi:MAG TPA: PPOX class F420-dependent oxidoreductase [Amycolatopsis sp.]|uniref:PPOX class F420-dependent oxidoreductase n=1 Tax=Amycolatopsis sp. TaxID=37632 RepID=UPI002B483C28|nr:PPOX class F420-dependent oxidoreductase [Amycolatopsis sp.]HKS47129.1 PPOX class F420-dependent oxidoreductase [Amycolatopsis sp.]